MNNSKPRCTHMKIGEKTKKCGICYTYSHVPLGVINPPPSSPLKLIRQEPSGMIVQSKPFRIANRTHDHNEIIHKNTLPQRLKSPLVYIQKIVEKGERKNPLLTTKHSTSQTYERAIYFFKSIAQTLPEKTKHSLRLKINEYFLSHGKSIKDNHDLLIEKVDFIDLMGSIFSFGVEESEQFWEISYREQRFKSGDHSLDCISMKAFIFNFQKYYISTLNFSNMFSESMLRQRMIDVRLALHDWNKKYKNVQLFERSQSSIQKELIQFSANEEYGNSLFALIHEKNNLIFTMRTLAKIIFPITDEKFLGYDKLTEVVNEALKRIVDDDLLASRQMKDFIENQGLYADDEFQVVRIIQYLKDEGVAEDVMSRMVKWIRNIYSFLYFYKCPTQSQPFGITFDPTQMKFHCSSILKITPMLVTEYYQFTRKNNDKTIYILQNLIKAVDHAMAQIPHLEGPKKKIVSCNYVVESLLRFIWNYDISCLWKVNKAQQQFQRGSVQNIPQIIKKHFNNENQSIATMKRMFSFLESEKQKRRLNTQVEQISELRVNSCLNQTIEMYQTTENPLSQLKLKERKKTKDHEKQGDRNRQDAKSDVASKISSQNRKCGDQRLEERSKQENKEQELQVVEVKKKNNWVWNLDAEAKESICSVETLESQLFELLQL